MDLTRTNPRGDADGRRDADGSGESPAQTLAAVARLLCGCSDRALEVGADQGLEVGGRPPSWWSSLGLGAHLLACDAVALIADDLHAGSVDGDGGVTGLGSVDAPLELVRLAEVLTRAHPIEVFPPGTSALIAGICDLIREHA